MAGHFARIGDHRLPKKIFFCWLLSHPLHGKKMRCFVAEVVNFYF